MINAAFIQSGARQIDLFRTNRTIASRPPYLSGQVVGIASISTAAREQVRLAQQELKGWEGAYDSNSTGHPDKYCAEIRLAEERLRTALLSN
jgi:hypothetical protein